MFDYMIVGAGLAGAVLAERLATREGKKGIIIDTYPQRDIDLAYALTVHKAQGSEYKNVIMLMNSSIFYMLSRELLYTAVTRARQAVTLITDQRALQTSLRVTEQTRLKQRRDNAAKKAKLVKL